MDTQLQFVRELLARMQIHSHIAVSPQEFISPDIDLDLRAIIFGLDNYASYLKNSMLDAEANTVYRFFDEYDCKYIFFRMPEQEAYFFIGPYLLAAPDEERIRRKAELLHLSQEQARLVNKYYLALPVVTNEEFLIAIVSTLADMLWGKNHYHLKYVEYMISDRNEPFPYIRQQEIPADETPQSLALLERIYASENQMMTAVKEGKLHKIATVASFMAGNSMERRTADTLRNRKNYLVILKTLLRKAAEYGNVHPLYLDRESSMYARLIEDVQSIRECDQLQQEMVKSFCLLVKNYSLNQYSPLVGKAVTIIAFDLTADLRLKALAAQLCVHPNHLSSQFHKECGCTLTEYVSRKRIEHAVILLQKGEKQVQTIAAECGIQDVNYFIKLFKRHVGMTPGQYRADHGLQA